MIRDDILKSANTLMPWGGRTKKRNEMKGKPLLTVLFRQPRFFFWAYDKSKNDANWQWLHEEMEKLLYGISLIKPVKKCSCGKQLVYWSLYKGMVNGHYVICDNKECADKLGGGEYRTTLVKHTFASIYKYIQDDSSWEVYLEGFKSDYGLPNIYNYNKYFDWLSQNIVL